MNRGLYIYQFIRLFMVLSFLGIIVISLPQSVTTYARQNHSTAELAQINPNSSLTLEVSFTKSMPASQVITELSAYSLNADLFMYTWDGNRGWHFRKSNQTNQEAISEFQVQHRQFLEGFIRQLSSIVSKGNSGNSIEMGQINEAKIKILRSFREQLSFFETHGLVLSGIVISDNAAKLNAFISRNNNNNTSYRLTQNNQEHKQRIHPASNIRDNSTIQSNPPYPDNPWKFSPQHGMVGYDATSYAVPYLYSWFYWRDKSGFDSTHRAYEHDIVILSPANTYVRPMDPSFGTYYSNLPAAYIDNPADDNLATFTIGSNWAEGIETYTPYYTYVPVDVINAAGSSSGDVEPQLGSWAGTYDDGEDPPEWQESAFCATFGLGVDPANCIFADQTNTSLKFYNSNSILSYFPFNHTQNMSYDWDQNFMNNQFTCASTQYRAEYYTNTNLDGEPMFIQCEDWPINHDWGGGGPGNRVGNDGFSVRWTGRAHMASGTYTFIARADDGIRVWLDNTLIIDAWRDQEPTEYRTTQTVNDADHDIKVEYYENGGGAVAQFRWEAPNAQPQQVVVDEQSPGFSKGGAYWWEDWSRGYNNHMYWTCVNGVTADSWGEWRPSLTASGSYEVYAFIPDYHTNTNNAPYEIHYRDGVATAARPQQPYYNQWVSLGIFPFAAGSAGYVRLTDATGETASCGTQVGFDAMVWVPR